jgi:Fe-S cluster biosynthesis and repair protein YggX
MLYGKIETRVWSTPYRGKVLICTSKLAYDQETVKRICGEDLFFKMCVAMNKDSGSLDLNGYAIAIGRLVDCRPMEKEDEEKAFVNYRPDLYSHIYEDVKAIKPFPWKGTQGWKTVDQSIYKIELLSSEPNLQECDATKA